MSRSIDSRPVRSSALVDADTQFDLDLSDVFDQYPDGAVRGAGGDVVGGATAAPAPVAEEAAVPAAPVVPVGDPWVVAPAAQAAPAERRATPFGEVVAVANAAARHPVPPVVPVADPPATAFAAPVVDERDDPPTAAAGTSVFVPASVAGVALATAVDVPVDPAVARAVDPPTSVHSVFVTPPAGTPVVGPAVVAAPMPAAAARPPKARRRSGVFVALAGLLALALVGAGVGLALATRDDGGNGAAAASAPGQSVALPPAETAKPADDDGADVQDDAAPAPAAPAVDAAALEQAAGAVTTFLSVRGTDAERAVSSQGGRDAFTAALAASGATSAQGAPECAAGDAATFACVLATDQGDLILTVGADPDDPASSGFEVIAATA